jgi:hypothetical protein
MGFELKYVIFFLALFLVVPLGVMFATSSKLGEKVVLFMMIFFTCRLEETINFVSVQFYRGTSRGYEVCLVDLTTLVLFFVIILKKDFEVTVLPPGSVLYFIYFFFSVISIVNSGVALYSGFEIWKMLRMYFYFWVLYNYFNSFERIEQAFTFLPYIILYIFIISLNQKYREGVYQINGPLPHQNSLCMYMTILGSLMFAQLLNKKETFMKSAFIFAAFGMASLTVMFTLSRAGMICYIGGLCLILFISYASGFEAKKLVVTGIMIFIGMLGMVIMVDSIVKRFETAPAASRITRYNLAVTAINMANDKTLGIGLNNFGLKVNKPWPYSEHLNSSRYPKDFREGLVETIYLMIAAETGWHNMVVFIIFIFTFYFKNLLNIFRLAKSRYQYTAIGIFGGLSAIYIQSTLEWVLKQSCNYYQVMLVFAIVGATATIIKREKGGASVDKVVDSSPSPVTSIEKTA